MNINSVGNVLVNLSTYYNKKDIQVITDFPNFGIGIPPILIKIIITIHIYYFLI